jgi:hypothetical protein
VETKVLALDSDGKKTQKEKKSKNKECCYLANRRVSKKEKKRN